MPLVPTYTLRFFVPLDLGFQSTGSSEALIQRLEASRHVAPILAEIRSSSAIGHLGKYSGVVEMTLGVESYIPGCSATPTHGSSGQISSIPMVAISTYMGSASFAAVEALVEAIADAHPWEHPIIECLGPEGARVYHPRI